MSQNFSAYKICQQALREKWYIQGFNGLPIFLNSAAYSGLVMGKDLGYQYNKYFLDYHQGYCEVGYLEKDLECIWQIVKRKLVDDPNYLNQVKKQYSHKFANYNQLFQQIKSNQLKELTDDELVKIFKECAEITIKSAGSAHVIESVGMGLEKDFKKQLQSAADSPKDFNEYFTVLTAPSEPSFLAREEAELIKIAKRSSSEQAKKLAEHAAKYFWLSNSYAKVRELSAKYFTRRLRSITNKKQISEVATKKKKAVLIDQLQLDSAAVANIELIDFTTSWQDERKANILQAIGYLKRIVDEISRRTKIAKKYLYYLGVRDIINLNSFSDLKAWQTELRKRSPGVFFLMQTEKEHVLTGQEYLKISKYRTELEKEMSVIERELHGSVAMTGTAIGRAVICRGLSSLAKVRPGDIIVASMTRPEFMPALRKAAGIVTDEGGITCHAAIVARELNIPTVIGTKKATKIFRDGMKIEVRANHGIVRELK